MLSIGLLLSIGDSRLSNWDCIFAVGTVELVLLTIYRRHLLLTKPHAKDVECDWQLEIMGLFLSSFQWVLFTLLPLRVPLFSSSFLFKRPLDSPLLLFFRCFSICRHDCPESTDLASQHPSASCLMAVALFKLIYIIQMFDSFLSFWITEWYPINTYFFHQPTLELRLFWNNLIANPLLYERTIDQQVMLLINRHRVGHLSNAECCSVTQR